MLYTCPMKANPATLSAFCAALSESCNVGTACAAVNICRQTVYRWRVEIPGFGVAWDRALKIGISALEDEIHRRAFEGVDKPVMYMGRVIDHVKEYSDTLAIFLLKAHAPDKYRDRASVDLRASVSVQSMTEEEIEAEIAALVAANVVPALPAPLENYGNDLS